MITDSSEVFTLHVERCRTSHGRFNWIVRSEHQVLRRCLYSASTVREAHSQGQTALQELIALWRDSR